MFNDKWQEWLTEVNDTNFEAKALELFRYQATNNPVYARYIELLHIDPNNIKSIYQIPYLPIELFKGHTIQTGTQTAKLHFESSGTTGMTNSVHHVPRPEIYEWSYLKGFKVGYGNIEDYCVLALLPSYLERENSSLVYMVKGLIECSGHPKSGFYLHNLKELSETLKSLAGTDQKVLLIGVTFALLDLVEQHPQNLQQIQVMETGGMKGRRKEMIREELHEVLKSAFGLDKIYSEYGMTELLSQAYTDGTEWFYPPEWMRVVLRDPYDPFDVSDKISSGAINVIDLANIDSCAFIATGDLGKMEPDSKRFQVLGRMDNTALRGCNLMVV